MALVQCIRQLGDNKPGDLVEIPDGAEYSDYFFEPVNTSGKNGNEQGNEGND